MPFNDKVAAEVLSKCARHCCICRRFRPRHIQVHHIVPESEGGASTVENAFPVCVTCHIDVHSVVPFTRRFTADEICRHRDAVFQLVAAGVLRPNDDDTLHISADRFKGDRFLEVKADQPLRSEAIELLIDASEGSGALLYSSHMSGISIRTGKRHRKITRGREDARYREALNQLLEAGLLEGGWKDKHSMPGRVTNLGYTLVDDIAAKAPQ